VLPYALARPVIDVIVQRTQQARAAAPREIRDYETEFPLREEFYRKAYERGLDVEFALAAGVMQAF
jgi:hypothetical protein